MLPVRSAPLIYTRRILTSFFLTKLSTFSQFCLTLITLVHAALLSIYCKLYIKFVDFPIKKVLQCIECRPNSLTEELPKISWHRKYHYEYRISSPLQRPKKKTTKSKEIYRELHPMHIKYITPKSKSKSKSKK